MHAPTSDIRKLQPVMKGLGFAFTGLAAIMTFKAGYAYGGLVVGAFLGLVTVFVGLALPFVEVCWRTSRVLGAVMAAVVALAFLVEVASHNVVMGGVRTSDITNAVHQDSRHEDARKAVGELERALAKLEAKHDWTKSLDPPSAYDARIATAAKAIEVETTRGGCKDKCLARKAEHASLVAEQAIAADRLAVGEEIKATRGALDKARSRASVTTKGDSSVRTQTTTFAMMGTGSLRPTEAALAWTNITAGAIVALLTSIIGSVAMLFGYRDWPDDRRTVPENPAQPRTMVATPAPSSPFARLYSDHCEALRVSPIRYAA
jgi:hypothetical protein